MFGQGVVHCTPAGYSEQSAVIRCMEAVETRDIFFFFLMNHYKNPYGSICLCTPCMNPKVLCNALRADSGCQPTVSEVYGWFE